MSIRRIQFATVVIGLAASSGCLEVEADDDPGMCETTADCDYSHGEVCDEGTCWGNPPKLVQFAALLVNPEEKDKYVPTELPELAIGGDGTIFDLEFTDYVTISGRVVLACADGSIPDECNPEQSIAAQIRAERPSRIRGGPTYTRTVLAEAGREDDEVAFELRLPVASYGDQPYQITITPDNEPQSEVTEVTPAQLAPPIRFTFEPTEDMREVLWVLGDPEKHKIVRARVVDGIQAGLEGMQIVAEGRWLPTSIPERASSLAITDEDGWFSMRIPLDMLDLYDVVVKPAPGTEAPWLRLREIYIPDPEIPNDNGNLVELPDLEMPTHSDPLSFVVTVAGLDSGGADLPVAGAEVRLTTVLSETGSSTATYEAQGFTDGEGHVEVRLIPGGVSQNRTYQVKVTPPLSSEHAIFAGEIRVGQGNVDAQSFLAGLTLNRRVAIHATVLNASHVPVAFATVAAKASVRFKWSLSLDEQAAVGNLQFPTTTTDENGSFTMWLDPVMVGLNASYDLDIAPPAGAYAPRWSVTDIDITAADLLSGDKEVADVILPPGSFARGLITSGDLAVPGAEFHLFQISENDDLCVGAIRPLDLVDCVAPAHLRGVWASDEYGWVDAILPDPHGAVR